MDGIISRYRIFCSPAQNFLRMATFRKLEPAIYSLQSVGSKWNMERGAAVYRIVSEFPRVLPSPMMVRDWRTHRNCGAFSTRQSSSAGGEALRKLGGDQI